MRPYYADTFHLSTILCKTTNAQKSASFFLVILLAFLPAAWYNVRAMSRISVEKAGKEVVFSTPDCTS